MDDLVNGVLNNSPDVVSDAVLEISRTIHWLEAVGFVIVLWVAFQVISVILNRKKRKELYTIKSDIQRIEKKLDKVLKKK